MSFQLKPGMKVVITSATNGFPQHTSEMVGMDSWGLTVRHGRKDATRSKARFYPWAQVAWIEYEADDPLPPDAPLHVRPPA
jgi:hypothetical protein